MKRSDIKAGVVYAYQADSWRAPQPIVFLSETQLYKQNTGFNRDRETSRFFLKSDQPRPHKATYSGGAVGLPAVTGMSEEDLCTKTLADFEAVTSGGSKYRVIYYFNHITGLYSEVMEAREEASRKRAEHSAAARAAREDAARRGGAVVATLAQCGVKARYSDVSSVTRTTAASPHVRLDLAEAEKLAALLEDPE